MKGMILILAWFKSIWVKFVLLMRFYPIFFFSFCLTKLPKMKICFVIFCTMFYVCKARQARQKWKIKNNETNNYIIFLVFVTFVTFVNRNEKWKMGWKSHKCFAVFWLDGQWNKNLWWLSTCMNDTKLISIFIHFLIKTFVKMKHAGPHQWPST